MRSSGRLSLIHIFTAWAKQNGHAIHQKIHTADRWVAATALAYGLELAATDGIYDGIAGLSLLKPPP